MRAVRADVRVEQQQREDRGMKSWCSPKYGICVVVKIYTLVQSKIRTFLCMYVHFNES